MVWRYRGSKWTAVIGLLFVVCSLVVVASGYRTIAARERTTTDLLGSQRLDLAVQLDELALGTSHIHPAVRSPDDSEIVLVADIETALEQVEDALDDLFTPYDDERRLLATLEPLTLIVDTDSLDAVRWVQARVIAAELMRHADELVGSVLDVDDPIVTARRHGVELANLVVDELTDEPFDAVAYVVTEAALREVMAHDRLAPERLGGPEELPTSWDIGQAPDFDTFRRLSQLITALDEAAVPSQNDASDAWPKWLVATAAGLAVTFGLLLGYRLWSTKNQGRTREAELRRRAATDQLTGLLNRTQLGAAARSVGASSASGLGVIYIDLDGFKAVNDSHGHHVGDRLLIEVARRIRRVIRATDHAVRIGGDEFVVLVGGIATVDDLRGAGARLVDAISEMVIMEGTVIDVGASAGCVLVGSVPADIDPVVRDADAALYAAKRSGRGRVVVSAHNEERPVAPGRTADAEANPSRN